MIINYDGKKFRSPTTSSSGDAAEALYHQDANLVWAEFAGHNVRRGSLAGTCASDGTLEFAYCMVLDGGEVISGRSISTPQLLKDGRIRLHEEWERYGSHAASGVSSIEEVGVIPPAPPTDAPGCGARSTRSEARIAEDSDRVPGNV